MIKNDLNNDMRVRFSIVYFNVRYDVCSLITTLVFYPMYRKVLIRK